MGPKKAKKTKAELEEERLAREEEERKAKLAEEKRQAEEREKRRKEEARIATELKVIRGQDLDRWKAEYEEFVDELKTKHQQLLAEEKVEADRVEWLRYKDPHDEIDPTSERDMNTFLTLTREQPVADLKDAMETVSRVERLAVAVQHVWSDSLAAKNYALQERAFSHLHQLRELVFDKLDAATVPLLRTAEKFLNDRQELNVEERCDNGGGGGGGVALGLWATYNDIRPIRKSVQFEAMGVQVDLPKQVLQQHDKFVYRVVRMSIVTHNLEVYMRDKGLHSVTLSHNEHYHANRLAPHHHTNHHHLLGRGTSSQSLREREKERERSSGTESRERDREKERERDGGLSAVLESGATAVDTTATATATSATAESAADAPSQEEKERERDGEHGEGVTASSPAIAAVPSLSLEQRSALESKYIVGDLVYFDMLYAPASPFNLRAKKWLLRDASAGATTLRRAAYPSSVASRFFIKVPESVALTDDLRVAVWSEDARDWVEDGLADYQYSAATRVVQFYATTTGVFALVKRRHADLPLRAWDLRPVLDKPVNRFMKYAQSAELAAQKKKEKANKNDQALEKEQEEEQAAATGEEGTATAASAAQAAAATASADGAAAAEPDTAPSTAAGETSSSARVDEMKELVESEVVNVLALAAALQEKHESDEKDEKQDEDNAHFEQHARLTLQSAQFEVVIDIVGAQCMLVQPDAPHCRDLLRRPLSPGVLLMELQKRGMQLVPTDHDLEFALGNSNKRRVMEDEMWRNVASCASGLEFSNAREWNTSLTDAQIGVRVRESTTFACPAESFDWECVLAERDLVSLSYQNTPDLGTAPGPDSGILYTLVLGNEYGTKKAFSHAPRPGEVAHIEFRKTLERRLTPEAVQRVHNVNPRFQKTVYTLLSLIKVFSQC